MTEKMKEIPTRTNQPFNALRHISNENYIVPERLKEKIKKIYE